MRHLIGIVALILSVLFALCVVYCIIMAVTFHFAWIFVGMGILATNYVLIAIARVCLKP